LLFAAIGAGLAAYASLRLQPFAIRESTRIVNDLMATQLSAEIQPRVFDEDFPTPSLCGRCAARPGDGLARRVHRRRYPARTAHRRMRDKAEALSSRWRAKLSPCPIQE